MAGHLEEADSGLGSAATTLLWTAANVALAAGVGQWMVISGGVCAALGVVALVSAVARRRAAGRVLADAVLVGTLVNFNAWAFSHLGNLMTFLGLFFFALFGLILGAALFRLLSRFRPLPRWPLRGAGVAVVLVSWAGGVLLEASYLPGDVLDDCKHHARLSSQVTARDLQTAIPRQVREVLAGAHRGHPAVAYVLWNLRRGKMDLIVPGRGDVPLIYSRPQRRLGFAIRLVASLVLLTYAVFSQIRWLTHTPQQEHDFKIARNAAREGTDPSDPAHSHSIVAGGFDEMS